MGQRKSRIALPAEQIHQDPPGPPKFYRDQDGINEEKDVNFLKPNIYIFFAQSLAVSKIDKFKSN